MCLDLFCRAGLKDVASYRFLDRLPSAMNAELAVDLFEVAVDRVVGDIQSGRNLLVPQALREEIEDIQLAVGQLFMVSFSHHMLSSEVW